jgi:hypothetical protein
MMRYGPAMRTVALLVGSGLALTMLFVGCRTQPLEHPIGTDDFGVTNNGRDMSMARIDMSVTNGTGCSALLDCLSSCQSDQCQNQCFNDASPDAQNLLTQALDCIYGFCQMQDGTRPPRCDENFEDPGDAAAGGCNQCLTNAFASLGGYDCMPKNSPDCSPASCQGFVVACQQQ